MTYFDCWSSVAAALFSQALAGEPEFTESLPKPLGEGACGFAATISGDVEGRFTVMLDGAVLEAPLMGEGADQKAGWNELLREAANSAAGDLYAKEGKKCQITIFEEVACERQITNSFQLRAGDRSWTILVRDEVRAVAAPPPAPSKTQPKAEAKPAAAPPPPAESKDSLPGQISPGFELLLDVELEASLRFGSREMPLGEILELGPGDVVELDRHITDPVDLIVGDKIVARGEVVLVNGNFGLKVSEVAEPKKRLESIRCLF